MVKTISLNVCNVCNVWRIRYIFLFPVSIGLDLSLDENFQSEMFSRAEVWDHLVGDTNRGPKYSDKLRKCTLLESDMQI